MNPAEISALIGLVFGILFFTYASKYYVAVISLMLSSIRSDIFRAANWRNGNDNGNGYKTNDNGHNGNGTNGKNGDSNNPLFRHRHLEGINGNGNGHNGNGHLTNDNDHNGNGNGNGNGYWNGSSRIPFVSVHIPMYNEKNVANRILEACTSLEYPEYEVIVADDSNDETVEIIDKWKTHPRVKIIRRENRTGFKGGALSQAIKHMDPRAEYVIVFDADFIPPPQIIQQMLVHVEWNRNGSKVNGNGHNGSRTKEQRLDLFERWVRERETAAVQGYQWHVLNASENWLTRGIRAEYSGNYLVERSFQEKHGTMKMIAGSVFMIKASILKRYGWTPSLTEDWDLTLRLYRDGYDVKFTPYVAAPAECPSTLIRLIRQRMRWAEGHTFSVRKYFWEILKSRLLNWREKLEFLYYAPYYLQSVFFTVGTVSWLLSEWFHGYLPFWAAVFGWSLVLTNLIALPLTNLSGLFLEYDSRRDSGGVLAAILLSYVLVPFQAIAALKGLLESKEGVWFRTFKTGKITEKAIFFKLRKAFKNLGRVPGRRPDGRSAHRATELSGSKKPAGFGLALALSLLLLGVFLASNEVRYARAVHTPSSITLWLTGASGTDTSGVLQTTTPATTSVTWTKNLIYTYTSTATYNLDSTDNGNWHVYLEKTDIGTENLNKIQIKAGNDVIGQESPLSLLQGANLIIISVTVSQTYTGVNIALVIDNGAKEIIIEEGSDVSGDTKLVSVPEYSLLLLFLAPFLPVIKRKLR